MNKLNLSTAFIVILSFIALTSCGGGGSGGDETTPTPEATISGTLSITANVGVDLDINDPSSTYVNNDDFDVAQKIDNTSTIQGFLTESATGTQGDIFFESPDSLDVYEVKLQKGQEIRLQVVDFDGFEGSTDNSGDLDLALFNEAGDLIGRSQSTDEFEAISVTETGRYFVAPYAYSGRSKYILQTVPASPQANVAGTPIEFVTNEAIVKMSESNTLSTGKNTELLVSAMSHTQEHQRAALVKFEQIFRAKQSTFTNLSALAAKDSYDKIETLIRIKRLRQSPGVEYATPNYIHRTMKIPDDEFYQIQWHYPAMNLPQAWDITTGSNDSRDIIVAVIDTGVVPHPDIEGQMIAGYDFISDIGNAADGDGIDSNADDPGDSSVLGRSSWHGTHVAGTVAAKTNNTSGLAGVSWGAKIMPIRVLGTRGGTTYDIMQGVRFAAGLANDSNTLPEQPADIINLSLGGFSSTDEERSLYNEVYNKGIIIIAAAGNSNNNALLYPASYDGVVSVSAVGPDNNRAPYSNFGAKVDIAAPGGDTSVDLNNDGRADGVWSLSVDDSSGERKAVYKALNGTSMASPHVAGMAALMKAIYPELTPVQFDSLLTNGRLTQDDGEVGRDDIYGHGRADALLAVQEAQMLADGGNPEPPSPQPPAIVASPTAINFANQNSASLEISNNGEGTVTLGNISDNVDWLTVTAQEVDAQGLGTYLLEVNRDNLLDGSYTDKVTFNFDAGITLDVAVSLSVGNVTSQGVMAPIYIVLYDIEREETVFQVTPTISNNVTSYAFSDIPDGDYLVVSGTDIDNDGTICDAGEGCGAYPTISDPEPIEIRGNSINNLDFLTDLFDGLTGAQAASSSNEGPLNGLPIKRIDY